MAKSDTLVIDLNSGADTGAAVPSIAQMIGESVAKPESNSGTTSLDDLHIEFSGPKKNARGEVIDPYLGESQEENARHNPLGARKRGRPSNASRGIAADSPKPQAKRKAELIGEVEQLRAELAAERARHDSGAVAQLATSIEMASHLCFGFAAEARGAHWAITEPEAKSIGKTGAVALAPYAEKMSAQLPWVVFAASIMKVVYTRVQIDRAMVAKLNAEK